MDGIKTEPDGDQLTLQPSDNTDTEENKPLSENRKFPDLHATEIKTECVDHSYDFTTEIKFEETAVPITFPTLEFNPEEGNSSYLNITTIKTEYIDCSYDTVPEMKIERTPVVKCEAEEGSHNIAVKKELDLEAAAEDGVVTESSPVILDKKLRSQADRAIQEEQMTVEHSERSEQPSLGKPFQCSVCGKCFSHPGNMKVHKRIHVGDKPFTCNEYGTEQPSRCKPFQCSVCGKCFSHPGSMKVHKRIHIGDKLFTSNENGTEQPSLCKPFQCSVCGKCFSHPGSMKVHKRIHIGDKPFTCNEQPSLGKPFQCSVCGKCFSHPGSMKVHKRIHTGEKPFKCIECGKCFIVSSKLKIHMRMHTGEKPYQCQFCAK